MDKKPIRVNTGNYRVCKDQIGIAKSKSILSNHNDKDAAISALNDIENDPGWYYYCEEEVFYRNTMSNANGNPMDTKPGWVRMNT